MTGIKVIFGGAVRSRTKMAWKRCSLASRNIDTAKSYGNCEEMLGSIRVGSQFMIDTKWIGEFAPVPQPREILSQLLRSP
jgi:aryl-alcohol dehydrogenase-like predicted oxidoreductase